MKKRIAFSWHINWRYPLQGLRDVWRQLRFFFHRGLYGYAEEDWWSLDYYLCTWLPSALREYKKGIGHPAVLKNRKEWVHILEKIACGFEAKLKQDDLSVDDIKVYKRKYVALQKEFEEGMALFVKWFDHLWD